MPESDQVAILTILLATCETALQRLWTSAAHPVDEGFAAELESLIVRTRAELKKSSA